MKDKAEAASGAARRKELGDFVWKQCVHHPGEPYPNWLVCRACALTVMAAREARGRAEELERAAQEVRAIEAEVEDSDTVVNLCDELERRIRALASETAALAASEEVAIPASSVGTKG